MTSELERLRREARGIFAGGPPSAPPLPILMLPIIAWFERRHVEEMRTAGFADARIAFKSVFIHLSPEGDRLTDLAARADMTKQAMAELVEDMVARGYLVRLPDPSDGRAKLILWAPRGLEAHRETVRIFSALEAELTATIGAKMIAELRGRLGDTLGAIRRGDR